MSRRSLSASTRRSLDTLSLTTQHSLQYQSQANSKQVQSNFVRGEITNQCCSLVNWNELEGARESAYLRQANFYQIVIETHFCEVVS